jgi:hypothetical protein
MPEEKSSSYLDVKELGSLRKKIIFHLSENPNLNAQALQKNLGYPSSQYPNILKALKTLEKLDLINSTTGKSKKNVLIRLYRCTLDGVLYALAENPNANTLNTLNAYRNIDQAIHSFRKMYDVWGHEIFMMFIRDVHEFLPMIHKDGLENVMPYMLMKFTMQMRSSDRDTNIRNAKETLKQFPHAKKILKDWADSVHKLL